MTARDLHALPLVPEDYSGGFTTERGTEFVFGGDDLGVHIHRHVGHGGGMSNHYDKLTVQEALEHILALEKCIVAATNHELRRTS